MSSVVVAVAAVAAVAGGVRAEGRLIRAKGVAKRALDVSRGIHCPDYISSITVIGVTFMSSKTASHTSVKVLADMTVFQIVNTVISM